MTQFSDQVRIKLISQLIKGIPRVLQKLLKYFNGTAISAFIIPALLVLSKNLDLNFNDSEFVIVACGSSLQNWYKPPDVFDKLSLYFLKLYFGITASRYFALSTCVSFILVMQLVNGPNFLNTACLLFLSATLAASYCSCSNNSYASFKKYIRITIIT